MHVLTETELKSGLADFAFQLCNVHCFALLISDTIVSPVLIISFIFGGASRSLLCAWKEAQLLKAA